MSRRSPRSSRRLLVVTVLAVLVLVVLAVLGGQPVTTSPTGLLGGASSEPGASEVAAATPAVGGPLAVAPGPSGSPASVAPAWRVAFAWHVPVLMYHLVATPAEAGDARPGLVVPPALFAAQMTQLRDAGWRTITASTLASDMAAGTPPAPRTFVITIDDGHADGYAEAFPILQQDGFVATYYVPTERIGHPGYLTPDELTTMAAAGMEIADHTINHVPLALVPQVEALSQIDGSETALDQLLGARPTTLAYPYGSHDPAVMADVNHAGFLLAFTTVEGCRETIGGRLAEPRMRVSPGTTAGHLVSELDRCAAMPSWG